MAKQEHVDLLKQGVKVWEVWHKKHLGVECDLSGADLRKADLRKADLLRANLSGANLSEADLSEADLRFANISKANLSKANLSKANFNKTNLSEVTFSGANLSGANFSNVTLSKADLRGANLRGASLYEADLSEADLSSISLYGGNFFSPSDLSGADLSGANLSGANLSGADLSGSNLSGADLSSASLYGANLSGSNLSGADLSATNLRGANLSGADLSGVSFDAKSKLENVTLVDDKQASVSLVDISWNGVNLAVIEWEHLRVLGNERIAHNHRNFNWYNVVEYERAVRASRQLAVVLREQGLNEDADRFAYRAQRLKRVVLRKQMFIPEKLSRRPFRILDPIRFLGAYLFSWFLDILAGYGYRPERSALAYLLVIIGFAFAYWRLGDIHPLFPDALIFSILSFHGRGFFPSLSAETALHNPAVIIAAFEAIAGLLVEVSLIATFTQRFFAR